MYDLVVLSYGTTILFNENDCCYRRILEDVVYTKEKNMIQ